MPSKVNGSYWWLFWPHISNGILIGLSRKLETAAKKRGGGQIRPWIKGIVNHTYWVAASSGKNAQLKLEKWKSISNRMINVHYHDSELYPECEHSELEPRDWMRQGNTFFKVMNRRGGGLLLLFNYSLSFLSYEHLHFHEGSRCHKMVKEIVESPYLLRDLPKLSHVHQTYGLEVFHSVVNHFAPKSTHFFYTPMLAR